MRALTKARRKRAKIARKTAIATTAILALIATRRRTIARSWAIANCTGAIFGWPSKAAMTLKIQIGSATIVTAIATVIATAIVTGIATVIVIGIATVIVIGIG